MKHVRRLPELTTKGKILVGLGVFVVIAVIGTYVVTSTISKQLTSPTSVVHEDFTKKDTATRQIDASTTANNALKSGNDKQAADIYKAAISAEPDSTKKVELAIDQSRMLSYSGKYDEAIEVAKNAESLSEDKYLTADWLARLYAKAKRYSDAATYYTKASLLVDSPTNIGKYKKEYYTTKATSMKLLAEKQ